MESFYQRTPQGHHEISDRKLGLTRWQRATLIVIGHGKSPEEMQHAMRQMPEWLDDVLRILIDKGLITISPIAIITANAVQPETQDSAREIRRYLHYLIGIVENANAAAALGLTIALKKAGTLETMHQLYPKFLDALDKICGGEEATRLLQKLARCESVPAEGVSSLR
jgi:hypothetical protein